MITCDLPWLGFRIVSKAPCFLVTDSIKENVMVALSETQINLHIVHYTGMSMNEFKSTRPHLSGVGSKVRLLWRIFGWVRAGQISLTNEQLIEDHERTSDLGKEPSKSKSPL
jgi:hypothetical protein